MDVTPDRRKRVRHSERDRDDLRHHRSDRNAIPVVVSASVPDSQTHLPSSFFTYGTLSA
ncbi:hypothetical protein L195_g040347 [Trifolium pratense]|uniref:Uncharacterized protein n=1 Tax=Trifolium pratense TaxID=57577 RepID=A0A2K3M0I0_TRIPR|nr:hypothetical protein L195_g040347 [Trifolium pratense]